MQELIDKRQEQRADIYKIERQSETEFTINGHKYVLLTEYRDAFQTEKLEERFSSILSKYDYIVGDWGFDQLRLKGFFGPDNPLVQKTTSVDTIQDYLYEYCNFGCAYFIIQNLEVKLPKPEHQTKKPNRKRNTRNGSGNNNNKKTGSRNQKAQQESHKTGTSENKKKRNSPNHRAKNNDPKKTSHNNQTQHNKQIKPQIKERQVNASTKPVKERTQQTATRVASNNKSKQKFVIRHK
jgi:uncharacterized protein YutD